MISQIEQALRPMGVGAPIRFQLNMQVVKLKLNKPLEGSKIQLYVKAHDTEKKIEVSQDDIIRD